METDRKAIINKDLMGAVAFERIEEIRELRNAGADVNTRDKDGNPMLIVAVIHGRTKAIRELLTERAGVKADVNAKGYGGKTALMWVAINGLSISESLNKGTGIETSINDDRAAIYYDGQTEAIRTLLKARADIRAKENGGNTAFDLWKQCNNDHPLFQKISDLLNPER